MNPKPSLRKALILCLTLTSQTLPAQPLNQDRPKPNQIVVYKQAEDREGTKQDLTLHIFYPKTGKDSNPAVLIFHGGVFGSSAVDRMHQLAARWKQRGFVAIAVEFRTLDRFEMARTDGLNDPFEAIDFVHENARSLKVDPNRIVVCGGSGGGYVSAALATLERKKAGLPAAAVVFNGMMDLTATGANPEVVKAYANEDPNRCAANSPLLHVDPSDSPIIQFHGTADKSTVWSEADRFNDELVKHGVHSEFHSYGGKAHGFWKGSFRPGRSDNVIFDEVMSISMRFLRELEIVD